MEFRATQVKAIVKNPALCIYLSCVYLSLCHHLPIHVTTLPPEFPYLTHSGTMLLYGRYWEDIGLAKSLFRFFRSILQKNSNEIFGQPNAKVNKSLPYMANTITNIETHVKKKNHNSTEEVIQKIEIQPLLCPSCFSF